MKFKKTHDIADITISLEGNKVAIGGWVEDLRKLGDRKSTRLNSSHT